jgi:hypothetical protein
MSEQTLVRPEEVAVLLKRAGEQWMLHASNTPAVLAEVADRINEFREAYSRVYGEEADVIQLMETNLPKGTAFLQTVTLPFSLRFRILAWRLLRGAEIDSIRFEYQRLKSMTIRVTIQSTDLEEPENFESDDPWDFRLFHHLQFMLLDGEPLLEGFFPLASG